jgi:hypothetical protein
VVGLVVVVVVVVVGATPSPEEGGGAFETVLGGRGTVENVHMYSGKFP